MIEAMLQAERLLTMGMLDQAENLYRRAADTDPRNAMAVVGLSRVASERGDDVQAYKYACAALEVDPQNALALRLEARLSEMLAARGEAVERPAWITGEAAGRHAPAGHAGPIPPAAAPAEPGADLGALAERTTFTRNPSMDDHQRRMADQQEAPEPATPQQVRDDEQVREEESAGPRRSWLRRVLGR
jgi:tetratricopeptide (TPR) repeat protein